MTVESVPVADLQPDLVTPPVAPAEGDLTVTVKPAEADPVQQAVVAAGQDLYLRAVTAARHDALDRGAQLRGAWPYSYIGMSGASMLGVPLVGPVAFGEVLRLGFLSRASAKNQQLKTEGEDGYGLQCLRIANPSGPVTDGKVAVAIHPRTYTEGVEPADLAKERLATALEVVAAASDIHKSPIGYVIIPGATAQRAGLPTGSANYQTTVESFSSQAPKTPYDNDTVLVVPVSQASELAERIRGGSDELIGRVMDALAARFPGKREYLNPDHPGITKTLRGILQRVVDSDMGTRLTEKVMVDRAVQRVVDGKIVTQFMRVPTGEVRTVTDDVDTFIDASNPYNPFMSSMTATGRQPLQNASLRQMTGDETMRNIRFKLDEDQYGDLQLVRVALELLERRQASKDPMPSKDQVAEVVEEVLPKGEAPKTITLADKLPNMNRLRAGYVGRVAVASAVLLVLTSLLTAAAKELDRTGRQDAQPQPAPSQFDQQRQDDAIRNLDPDSSGGAIRVDNHGLQEVSPYWYNDVNYVYTTGRRHHWRGVIDDSWTYEPAPTQLENQKVPHLTVTFFGFGDYASGNFDSRDAAALPIEVGTKVGALRAFDKAGRPLDVQLIRRHDGVVIANLAHPRAQDDYSEFIVRYEYDLVWDGDQSWGIQPDRPLKVYADQPIQDPKDYPGADGGPSGLADYTSRAFTYDDTDALHRHYTETTGNIPGPFVAELYKEQRGNCAEVNSAIGMLSAALWPDLYMGLVNGYHHNLDPKNFDHTYLRTQEAHGWLNQAGFIIDGTPSGGSPAGTPQSIQDLDKTWQQAVTAPVAEWETGPQQNQQEHKNPFDLPKWPLILLGAIAAAAAEVRTRRLTNLGAAYLRWDRWVTANLDIDPRDAVQLLQWRAYGGPDSRMPVPSDGTKYRGEKVDNIPDYLLEAAARGKVEIPGLSRSQSRGVAHTAGAIRADRAHEAREAQRKARQPRRAANRKK